MIEYYGENPTASQNPFSALFKTIAVLRIGTGVMLLTRHGISAVLGPSICGACYEVPDALRREVAAVAPEAFTTTSQGSPGLDLPAGALAHLARLGVHAERLEACTRERADLFSYRRDGLTGRFGGAIVRHTT